MELMDIAELHKWQTSDGKEHYSLEAAQFHANRLNLAKQATDALDSGGSVADALRIFEHSGAIDPILEKVTKATKLVISYWQCRYTPGYQVQAMLPSGMLRVWGDAGSWSGPYGGDVSITDLVRYAKDEGSLLA